MKKLLCIISAFTVSLTCIACNTNKEQTETTVGSQAVTVNMPTNDTLNGYRLQGDKDNEAPDLIDSEKVGIAASNDNHSENSKTVNYEFIGNKNTKLFHKSTCSSAKNMMEENKIGTNDRSELINAGYRPCKRCKP